MNIETIRILNSINSSFYETVHESFSETRKNPWPGWVRSMEEIKRVDPSYFPGRVADFACGNFRYELFLLDRLSEEAFDRPSAHEPRFYTFDNCSPLQIGINQETSGRIASFVHHHEADIIDDLLDNKFAPQFAIGEPVDLSVSFGFMHHIPSFELRVKFIRSMLSILRTGGYAVISFWSFMDDPKIAAKAIEPSSACDALPSFKLNAADIEENDWLLGWADSKALRYCHHFSTEEIDRLVAQTVDCADVVAAYSADGKSGNLNKYVILRKE